jgi:hypothetical protein
MSPASPLRSPLYIRFYSGLLDLTLRYPWAGVLLAASAWGLLDLFDRTSPGGGLGRGIRSPADLHLISIVLPRGSDLERVDELARFFEERWGGARGGALQTQRHGHPGHHQRVDFPEALEFTPIPPAIKEQM